jgi:hypothetical protein
MGYGGLHKLNNSLQMVVICSKAPFILSMFKNQVFRLLNGEAERIINLFSKGLVYRVSIHQGHFLLFSFKTGFPYTVQASFKLMILLPHPPKCWNYRCGH